MTRVEHVGEKLPPPNISRRKFVIGAGSALVAAGIATLLGHGKKLFEQEPAATTNSTAASKPAELKTPAPSTAEADSRAQLLDLKIVDLNGKQSTIRELTSQKPLVVITWSILDWGSWDLPIYISHNIFPEYKNNPNIQFLALEIWSPTSEVKAFFEKDPDRAKKVSFPSAVAPDYIKSSPRNPLKGTRGVTLIDIGANNTQTFFPAKFDQISPAIAQLVAAN